ncbi:substrate-binding domain-containing protein [Nonomuraea sp. NPDC049158]|uniref:substrate-binding domain-containing protein n=1 Tax=Nonomuraea sp. NPDC049158 TaxID=3155649 RepID=UPI0033DFBA3B
MATARGCNRLRRRCPAGNRGRCSWAGRTQISPLGGDCGVTAVIGASDKVAAGAIRGALDRGWKVPQDLSVTGWDDNPLGAILPPSLTTVAMEHEMLGRRVPRRLLATLRDEPIVDDDEPLTQVIWRESTGPAPSPLA